MSQQSRALHLPRGRCDGGHLKTNKSILLFVHSCAPQRWAGFPVCVCVFCLLVPLPPHILLSRLGSLLRTAPFSCLSLPSINRSTNKLHNKQTLWSCSCFSSCLLSTYSGRGDYIKVINYKWLITVLIVKLWCSHTPQNLTLGMAENKLISDELIV